MLSVLDVKVQVMLRVFLVEANRLLFVYYNCSYRRVSKYRRYLS